MMKAETLRALLHYDPVTGIFTWRKMASARVPAGSRAGSVSTLGYRRIGFGKVYRGEHRLAFLYMTGEWPAEQVDHINGDRSDNRWANLRQATRAENARNVKAHADNPSGLKGVHQLKSNSRWQACIATDGYREYLGTFGTAEEAHAAYAAAAQRNHGAFARV